MLWLCSVCQKPHDWLSGETVCPTCAKEKPVNLPLEAWRPASFDLTSEPGKRSPELYRRVLELLDVVHSPRYQRREGNTFCNIFAGDAGAAMGALIPHWVDGTGSPAPMSDANHETSGNGIAAWLAHYGDRYGWTRCSQAEAIAHAAKGEPVTVAWYNCAGSGHIAMVIPSSHPGCRIAQAGAANLWDADVASGFGSSRLPQLNYYWHP